MRAAILAALSVALGLTACAKSERSTSAAVSAAAAKNPASAFDGEVIYVNNCSSCHQPDGRGVPGAFPPLAQNPVVTSNPVAVIAIVKNGLGEPVVVNGQSYSGIMPRWNGLLSNEQLAAVITYIRSSWKNRASAVSASDVEAVK